MNRRLDDLILAIIDNPETSQRFGGGTLVDHYDRAHWLNESGKYVRRGGDKSRTTKLQELVGWFKVQKRSAIKFGNY